MRFEKTMFWFASIITKVLVNKLAQWPNLVLSRPMHSRTDVITCKYTRNGVRSELMKLSCLSSLWWLVVHKGAIRNELTCKFRSVKFAPCTEFFIVALYIE